MEEPIGARLRRVRTERGWSQNVLGYHADRAPSVISQVETGKRAPELSTVQRLAAALEVDWRWLLLGEEFLPAAPQETGERASARGEPVRAERVVSYDVYGRILEALEQAEAGEIEDKSAVAKELASLATA